MAATRAVVLVGYSALACLLTWPLPLHLRTHLLGSTGGDTGIYLWNLWIFRHELVRHARLPFSTDHVFAYTGGTDFALHNYTPVAGLLGFPLVGPLGVVGAYNVVMIAFVALSGAAAFLLARQVGLSRAAAGLCGAVFAASPFITARETAHLSLVIAAPLPLFLWALLRTLDTRRYRDAVLIGTVVAIATYSDAYYGIYCVVMGTFIVGWRFTAWSRGAATRASIAAVRVLDVLTALVAALIVWRAVNGPTDLVTGGMTIKLQTVYTPMLALSCLLVLRAWQTWRPRVRIDDPARALPRLTALGAVAAGVCLVLLSPLLVGIVVRAMTDRLPAVEVFWRSSPRGVDLLAYFVPNPNQAWFGGWTRPWFLPPRTDAFPEFVASFPLAALAAIAVAAWRGLLPRMWMAFTAAFVLLSLGPFVHVAGLNTYLPTPWALLRYVPVFSLARSPSRFAVVAALGLSLLFAFAVQELWRRRTARAPLWIVALAVALAVELLPAPRPLHAAVVPHVYELIATTARHPDEAARLLELPAGLRDGTSSLGNYNPASPFFQTRHRRPVIGGYLSRVSKWRKRRNASDPMMGALTTLSEGRPLSAEAAAAARDWRETFLRRSCVRYVILDAGRAPGGLREMAVDLLDLASVHRDGTYELFTPKDPPSCDPPPPRKRRRFLP
ncbi:MAG TPA: hypothetical protein VFK57_09730 [Vicinamibacterales bacterium]|nr:hypothetical protein [Vicinamibacterales bacterium]